MKNAIILILFALLFTALGCQMNESADTVGPIVDPKPSILISRDSISSGDYLGLAIDQKAEAIYAAVQSLQKTSGVSYLNVVSNFSTDITDLRNRIGLYQYILLDQNQGTDSGVQINLESGKVKSIYLNSGKQLTQWPENLGGQSVVRVGDPAEGLYEKFVSIKGKSQYAAKFERISLLTKNLSTSYDPLMAKSPQWYFAYTTGHDMQEVVKIYFQNEKVSYIEVERFKS